MALFLGIAIWIGVSAIAAIWACRAVNERLGKREKLVDGITAEDVQADPLAERHEGAPSDDDATEPGEREGHQDGGAGDDLPAAEESLDTGQGTESEHQEEPDHEILEEDEVSSDTAAKPDTEGLTAASDDTHEGEAKPITSPRLWSVSAWGLALACLAVSSVVAYLASTLLVHDWRTYVCCLICYVAALAAAITDAKLRLIFNSIPLALMGARVITFGAELVTLPTSEVLGDLMISAIGLVGCFVTFMVVRRIAHGGIGGGDVKLIAAIGFAGGAYLAVYALFFALLLSSLVALALIVMKKLTRKDSLPFAPFLYVGLSSALILLLT